MSVVTGELTEGTDTLIFAHSICFVKKINNMVHVVLKFFLPTVNFDAVNSSSVVDNVIQ